MKERKVFECDYCGKFLKTKWGMRNHEPRCFKNPKGINCYRCCHACIGYEIGYEMLKAGALKCKYYDRELTYNAAKHCNEFKPSDKLAFTRFETPDFSLLSEEELKVMGENSRR